MRKQHRTAAKKLAKKRTRHGHIRLGAIVHPTLSQIRKVIFDKALTDGIRKNRKIHEELARW